MRKAGKITLFIEPDNPKNCHFDKNLTNF